MSYAHILRVCQLAEQSRAWEEFDTQFTTEVSTMVFVDKDCLEQTLASLIEFYHGKITAEKTYSRIVEIPIY